MNGNQTENAKPEAAANNDFLAAKRTVFVVYNDVFEDVVGVGGNLRAAEKIRDRDFETRKTYSTLDYYELKEFEVEE